jgi:hypothetical protein
MQRINRSTHAPLGTAVFLFIGLAVLPLSLRATGLQISLSPRLSAATDAWQQIADVFGAGYQAAPDLVVVKDLDTPSTPIENPKGAGRSQFACAGKAHEAPTTAQAVPDAPSLSAIPVRRASSKSASRRTLPPGLVGAIVAADAIKGSFEKQASMLGAIGALKLATIKSDGLLKSIDRRLFNVSFEPIVDVQNPRGLKNVRVLVRTRAVAGSSTKTAERKVYSAMASSRRRECDRASLTGMTTATPDHSEF